VFTEVPLNSSDQTRLVKVAADEDCVKTDSRFSFCATGVKFFLQEETNNERGNTMLSITLEEVNVFFIITSFKW
jgi:hypothetical protein